MATLTEAQATLTAAEAAYNAALSGKTVTYGGRSVTYHDLDDLLNAVTHARRQVAELTAQAAGATNAGVVTPKWS